MRCDQVETEVGDYVDGRLPPDRAAAYEVHLQACPACRGMVEDLSAIRAAARTLEPQLPAAHVWTRIAAAIEHEQRRAPWWQLGTGGLAWKPILAAAMMVAVLGGSTWLAWRDATGLAPAVRPGAAPAVNRSSAESPIDPEVRLAEQDYTAAIGDLEKVTQTEGGSLDPDTARVVQANLAVIDEAIGQSRAALQSEPASNVAQDSLFDALRSKVQLLQDTVALINEMRKGNPDGAARIMSGMKP